MSVFRRYGEVLRPPGARTAVVAGLVGRVSLGMTGLALLLVVKEATGSYGSAGLVAASYAVAVAVGAPLRARTADRKGPAPVLVRTAVVHPMAFVALIALTHWHAPVVFDVVAGFLIGVTVPPLSSVLRALWGRVLEPALLPVAYSLEAVLVEICFVTGPLLVALVAAVWAPAAALAASAVCASAGALLMAVVPVVRRTTPHPDRPTHLAGPLVSPLVRACLLCVLCVGLGFGAIEVGVLAFVEEHGRDRAAAGVVLAVWSAGSALGGLVYGGLRLRSDASRQLPVLVVLVGVAAALPLLAPSVLVLALLLAVAGSTIAPWSAANSVLLGRGAPAGTVTEAFAWNGSMIFGGAAVGNALAGALADAHGAAGAFAVAAGGGACVVLASLMGLRALHRGTIDPAHVAF
ncbi:MAG TPA: MFS transporter [Mycobacteriales bacterium]|nr:MFS transporter [Mycobacteriales bacterium]